MSEFKSSNFTNEDNSGGPDLVGVTTFTSPYYFVPPSGTTAQRPSGDGLAPGMLRFNTDIGRLEVWRGDHWATILGESPSLNGGARGLFAGGYQNAPGTISYNIIDYVTISTLGNAIDFGDKIGSRYLGSSLASSTRGVWAAGSSPTTNIIEYVTISSTGDAIDFGDVAITRISLCACSNSTRGIIAGGSFGATEYNIIEYITISSTGDAQDFGDLSVGKSSLSACSSSTRGIIAGGYTFTPAFTFFNTIEYITISSTGNAQDFGDLSVGKSNLSACSSSIRGVFGGGYSPSINVIDYITILSAGNATDFGDLTQARHQVAGLSNGHGGL